MATPTLTSLVEYLASDYHPDREYIDGIVEERTLGEYDHARLQTVLAGWFLRREREWNIRVVTEQRIQVGATRFRVPDIAVLDRSRPVEQILTRPPLIVIEILSPQDIWSRMEERIADYLNFGIPNVWILEPGSHAAWTISPDGRRELTSTLKVAGLSPIAVSLDELFQELD